jgi:hypothetical protein
MMETPPKTTRWAELSDDVLESVEAARKRAIEAVRTFIDEVMIAEQNSAIEAAHMFVGRKALIDAALYLVEELVTAKIEFLRSVVRSAGRTLSKK